MTLLKWAFLAAVVLLAACQSTAPTETSVSTATDSASAAQWLETKMNGVTLGMWRPTGWNTDLNDGLVLVEQSVSANGVIATGLLIWVFVPPSDEFDPNGDTDPNPARALLDQVVQMPDRTAWDVTVTQPVAFQWDQQQAAYYLLTAGDGKRELVLALALPQKLGVVVCNISAPGPQANRIRTLVPQLLDGLTVNGTPLDGAALAALPDPLPFPRYSAPPGGPNQHVADGPPPH